MTENIQENIKEEEKIQTQNISTNNLEQKSESVDVQSNESNDDPNWKAFREARKKDRAEKEAAERRAAEKEAEIAALKAAMEAAFSSGNNQTRSQENQNYFNQNFDSESEEEKINKRIDAILAEREEKSRREAQERERLEYPVRLQKNYPDIGQVISQDNLDYLDYHYPEISRPLQRLPDGYDKWEDIYRAIKKLMPNVTTAKKESIKAEINSQKPKSISSMGMTQTGERASYSWQEVEQRRAARWQEMQRTLRGV